MVPLSDAIYLSISPIPGDDLRSNCPRPVPGTKLASFEFMDLFDLILSLVESRSIKSFYSLLLL